VGAIAGFAVLVTLAAAVPFCAGYLVPSVRVALIAISVPVVVVSFAPLGANQPAPWQSGFPADGDWRVVFFPFWVPIAVAFVLAGARARRSRRGAPPTPA